MSSTTQSLRWPDLEKRKHVQVVLRYQARERRKAINRLMIDGQLTRAEAAEQYDLSVGRQG